MLSARSSPSLISAAFPYLSVLENVRVALPRQLGHSTWE